MSDFLGNLVARSLSLPAAGDAPAPAVRPRLASRFEPMDPAAPPLGEDATAEGLESETIAFSRSGAGERDPALLSLPAAGGGALSRAAGEGWGGGDRAGTSGGPLEAPSPTLPRADARERAPSALPAAVEPARRASGEEGYLALPVPPRPQAVLAPPPALERPRREEPAPATAAPVRPASLTPPPPPPASRAAEERPRVEPVVRRVEVERVVEVLAPPSSLPSSRPETTAAAPGRPAPAAPAAPPAFLQPRVASVGTEPFQARREETAAPPAIHVTIGRIEVRATPAPKARERQAARPAVDLETYLRQRAQGEGR